jgi:hypothetical protein
MMKCNLRFSRSSAHKGEFKYRDTACEMLEPTFHVCIPLVMNNLCGTQIKVLETSVH